jgi:hypothetical protein
VTWWSSIARGYLITAEGDIYDGENIDLMTMVTNEGLKDEDRHKERGARSGPSYSQVHRQACKESEGDCIKGPP